MRHRGFFLLDLVVGLAVVAALSLTLAVAAGRYAAAAQRLDAERRGAAIAERVLNDLQIGRRPERVIDGATWSIVRIDASTGGEEIRGRTWVRVRVTIDRRGVEMIGAVPTALLEGVAGREENAK